MPCVASYTTLTDNEMMEGEQQHLAVGCVYEELCICIIMENNTRREEIFDPTWR